MLDAWSVLGLDGPTDDLKAIKKAYARMLKVTRPDDDPEGFLKLRNAFDFAKSFNSHSVVRSIELTCSNQPKRHDPDPQKSHSIDLDNNPTKSKNKDFAHSLDWRGPILEVLNDQSKLENIEAWDSLFNHKALRALDEFMDFEDDLMTCLLEVYGYNNRTQSSGVVVPEPIGKYIFKRMDWPLDVDQGLLERDHLNFLHMAIFSGREFAKTDLGDIKREIEVSDTKISGSIFDALIRVFMIGIGLYLIMKAFDGVESREQALNILIPAAIILVLMYFLIRTILWLVRRRW